MPRILEKLRIREVSAVDRGAGEGVKVMLMKRDFTDDQRKEMAGKGEAMADGSYPIANTSDLHNAIQAFGRSKNPAATKRHIIERAHALGATDTLPDDWKVSKMAKNFSDIVKGLFGVGKTTAADEIAKANDALEQSIASILADTTTDATAKSAAISKSFDQHADHLNGTIPAAIESALSAAGLSAADFMKGTGDMTDDEKKKAAELAAQKAKDDADADDTKKALAKALTEVAILKMAEPHRAYIAKRGDMNEAEQGTFAKLSEGDREAYMKAHPVKEDVEKRVQEEVAKRIASDPQVIDMKKRIDEMTKREEITAVRKGWSTAGLTEPQMDVVQKVWEVSADKAPIEAMVKQMAALTAQAREGGVFKEFGGSGAPGGSTPHDELMAKAAELRKSDPTLSIEQAYAKVYSDPVNHDIAKRDVAARREAIRA